MSDALAQLEADVGLIPAAIQARNLGSILGRVSEKTHDALRQAQRCVALVEMAKSLDGLSTATVETAARHAIKQTREIGEMLASAQGPNDLEAIYEDYGELIVALRDLDQQVRFIWSLKAKSDYASLIPVGHLLMRIAGAEALGRKLVDIGTKAEALAAKVQPAETLAPEIVSLKFDRQQALAEMAKFTESAEVDSFLDAVTKGAATLETVTPTVSAWLKAHGALGAFRVTG